MTDTSQQGVQITVISLRGAEYPVYVNKYGAFRATVEDHELSSDNLRDLRAQAERVPRRRVAVRFAKVILPYSGRITKGIRPGTVQHGTATGFHAANTDSLLVDWDGASRKGSMSGSRIDNTVLIDNEQQQLTIEHLLEAELKARREVAEWIEAHAFDPHAAVREALARAGDDHDH